jgi:hypothetical protein
VLGLDAKDSRLHMLDYRQRYVTISSDKITRGVIESLFGPNIGWLCDTYPKLKSGGRQRVPVGGEYNLLAVSRDLIRVAGGHPLFDPQCIRGSGAWPASEPGGCLIQNTGDSVVFWSSKGVPSVMAQGRCGNLVYPAGLALPRLASGRGADIGSGAAEHLLAAFPAWHFAHGKLDHLLLLGFIGQVFVGGAPRRRTCAVVSGEHATGKSTLLELLHEVCGAWLEKTADTTAAGILQQLAGSTCGVVVDEAEAEDHLARQASNMNMRRVLRLAYDGAECWRGGVDQVALRSKFRSPVMIAAVSPPSLAAAEQSRVVRFNLIGRPVGDFPTDLFLLAPTLGAELGGRISAAFHRLVGEDMPAWRRLLVDTGWDSRGADTVGQLLSISSLLVSRRRPAVELYDEHASALASLCEGMAAGRMPRWQHFLILLRGLLIEPEQAGQERRLLGDLLREGAGYGRFEVIGVDRLGMPRSALRESEAQRVAANDEGALKAQRRLDFLGIRVVIANQDVGHIRQGERVVVVANQSPMLASLVRQTAFADLAAGTGAWAHCLLQAPATVAWGAVRFAYGVARAVALPLDLALAGMVGEDAEGTAAAWEAYNDR